jgi:succinate dehydrogenase/fumarate reductase flavoprotein subunit
MSGSDKQTYYKLGTSPDVVDSAEEFAKTLTAAGCCHGDLALAEAIGSLREFYHLVQAGVPFPTDSMGSFIGYKSDHDPFERATSAGPRTSRFMSERLQEQLERYSVRMDDNQEIAHLLSVGSGRSRRIVGVVTLDKKRITESSFAINVYLGANIVLAAGGPGELYKTTVYPKGQLGIHGLAFKAGLAAENLTESQFGLASIKFRWNVSGSYMQAIPRIFSTDAKGGDQRDFLAGFFPSMRKMATNIFLKGYQWPFDPQRIDNFQSSLIDILVFNETQKGRRVFLDFLRNPVGSRSMKAFDIGDLEPEAHQYLKKVGALQATPVERLSAMNPLAVEIFHDNGIDLYSEPLEIALCAQHNNGGFAVDRWWQSNIPQTFVIGEMAGTHGVKRPGGSALNAGQVGGLRAAEYIVNVYGCDAPDYSDKQAEIDRQIGALVAGFDSWNNAPGLAPEDVIQEVQDRMTTSAGHIRGPTAATEALEQAVALYRKILENSFSLQHPKDIAKAVQAEHLALTSIAFLKAIVELLRQGSGSRGSHLVLSDDGIEIHPHIVDGTSGKPLKFKPENESLRTCVLRIEYDADEADLFRCRNAELRRAPSDRKAFEPAWQDYREGKIYSDRAR